MKKLYARGLVGYDACSIFIGSKVDLWKSLAGGPEFDPRRAYVFFHVN